MDVGVNVGHETMKMRARFALDLGPIEKEIHQHGLATPSVAPNVEAAHRQLSASRTREPTENARVSRGIAGEREAQVLQPAQDIFLTGVSLNVTGSHLVCIMIEERKRHPGLEDKAWRRAARRWNYGKLARGRAHLPHLSQFCRKTQARASARASQKGGGVVFRLPFSTGPRRTKIDATVQSFTKNYGRTIFAGIPPFCFRIGKLRSRFSLIYGCALS